MATLTLLVEAPGVHILGGITRDGERVIHPAEYGLPNCELWHGIELRMMCVYLNETGSECSDEGGLDGTLKATCV